MTKLEEVQEACAAEGILMETAQLPKKVEAIYYGDNHTKPTITVGKHLRTSAARTCALAEELGHYHTTSGNVMTDPAVHRIRVRKAEILAHRWAFRYVVSLSGIVEAWDAGARTPHEMGEHLGITEVFLAEALDTYEAVYGISTEYAGRTIHFNPLRISCRATPIVNGV